MRQLVRPDVDARAALVTLMDARGALLQLRVSLRGTLSYTLALILSPDLAVLAAGEPVLLFHVRGALWPRGLQAQGRCSACDHAWSWP